MRVLLALLVFFTSCSNSDTTTTQPVSPQDSLTTEEIELMKKGPIKDYPYYDSSPVHPNHSK